jgi:hypothetical protein
LVLALLILIPLRALVVVVTLVALRLSLIARVLAAGLLALLVAALRLALLIASRLTRLAANWGPVTVRAWLGDGDASARQCQR